MSVTVPMRAAETSARVRTFPVIEIFGPTIRGEGAEGGLPAHFAPFGGSDSRCSWSDTMYAVEPSAVRATAQRLSADSVIARLAALKPGPRWVTLSGGNPALQHADDLVDGL